MTAKPHQMSDDDFIDAVKRIFIMSLIPGAMEHSSVPAHSPAEFADSLHEDLMDQVKRVIVFAAERHPELKEKLSKLVI